MDGWERTKIWAGIGLAGGVMAGAWWFSGQVMAPIETRQRGYAVAGVPPVDLAAVQRDWPAGANDAEPGELLGYIGHIEKASVPIPPDQDRPVEAVPDLGTLLASADPDRGRRAAQVCLACHDLNQNGPDRIGPNLWGLVGRPVASHAAFAYSPALKKLGGQWTYQEIDRFLTSPGRAVPGTKMAFAGIRNPRDRAHLIAYLATIGAARPPYPEPAPVDAVEKASAGTP